MDNFKSVSLTDVKAKSFLFMGMTRIFILVAIATFSGNWVFGQTNTITSGNWTTAGNWSNGVPGNGTTTTVNHSMTLDTDLSPTGDYTFNAPVIDPSGGGNYNLTLGDAATVDINANTTVEGVLTLEGTLFWGASLTIRSGDTLTIGYPGSTANSVLNANTNLTIEAGGVLIVYGNLEAEATAQIDCEGEIFIDGNFHADHAWFIVNFPSDVSGSGSITTTGTMTSDGNSEIFGSTGNCNSGPCSGGSSPCGVTNTIASNQTICSGVTPATITGNNPTGGETYQWQISTTGAFSGFSNISGATGQNLTFSSGISTTTWYRRQVIKTGPSCTNTSLSVKVTVNPSVTASVSISASSTTLCSGSSVTFTATPTNGGGSPSYQWKRNGGNVGSNSTTYSNSGLSNGDVITCEMTSNASCVTGSPATSNQITVTVLSGAGSWMGATNINWNNNSNWCSGARPTASDNVTISGGAIRQPRVSSAAAVCSNLTLNSGAILTVSGNSLTPGGSVIINNGAEMIISGGTANLNGDVTINNGGILTLNSGTINLGGSITIHNGGTLNLNGGTINGRGAITNNGTISGTGTLLLNGTVSQTISGTGYYGNVTLNNSAGAIASGNVTVSGVLTLTSGAFTSNGNLSIDLNTGCIARTGSGSIVGNLNVSKTAYSSKYHYISSPLMTGMTVADWNDDVAISQGSQYQNLYYYDETVPSPVETDGWTAITNLASPLTPLKGYALFFNGPQTLDQSGTYTHGATPSNVILTNTVSSDPNTDGYNLVGNPYPTTLDWDAASGWTKTGIGNAIYFWDPVNDRYASYVGGIGTNGGTRYIPSMQGFWVRVTTPGGTGTFGMNNNVRVTTTNPTLWKTTGQAKNLVLKVKTGNQSDETVIRFRDDAGKNFDDQFDAFKLMNDGNTPSLYSVMDGIQYSVNSLPDTITNIAVPLHLKGSLTGSYSIGTVNEESFDESFDLILEDLKTETEHDLRTGEYSFNVSNGDTTGRFLLHFKQTAITSVNTVAIPNIQIYSSEKSIYCGFKNLSTSKATIAVYTIHGRMVTELENADISSGNIILPMSSENSGVYIVKVEAAGESLTRKVFIK